MIILTDELKKEFLRAYDKLGSGEFYRLFRPKNSNRTIHEYLRETKYITQERADKMKHIVDIDRYSEASHFKVSTVENIEHYSDLPVMQYFDDEQECINIYTELAKSFIRKLDEMLLHMIKHSPKDCIIWGLAFAIGSKHLNGRSMTEIARDIGVTRAAISKHARKFVTGLNLPTSPYMKTEQAAKVYRAVALDYHRNKKNKKGEG